MKKILLALLLFVTFTTQAQVGVGTSTPDASAQLEVRSSEKGFLPPRMTFVQRQLITSPAVGLIVWCTDCDTSGQLQVYDGKRWLGFSVSDAKGVPEKLLVASSLATFGQVCISSTGGPNSFTLSGSNLTAGDITVGPLSGYEFSTTSGGTYSSSLTIPQSGGTLASTEIYVRFVPLAVQVYDGDIPVSGGGALPVNVAATATAIDEVTPTFDPVGPYCQGDVAASLPTTSLNGIAGSWSDVVSTTTPGDYNYTFTPAAGACAIGTDITVTINEAPATPAFTVTDPSCVGLDGEVTITNYDINLSYSVTPSTGVVISGDKITAPAGDYSLKASNTSCSTTASFTINAGTPATNPQFTIGGSYCADAVPVLATTSDNGINGSWNPSSVSTSAGTVDYTFTPDAGQCAKDTTISITVNAFTNPEFDDISTVCENAIPVLNTTSNNGITGSWNPSAIGTAPGTASYTFTPDAGQCAKDTTISITVNALTNPEFDNISTVCESAIPVLNTTSNNGITGSWNPSAIGTTPGTATYTFTPDAGQCAKDTTISVTVQAVSSVETNAATAVSASGATLNGTVTSGCGTPTYGFEYSTTSGFTPGTGTSVAATQASGLISANLSGLSAFTTYYFIAKVTTGSITRYGTEQSFSTNYSGKLADYNFGTTAADPNAANVPSGVTVSALTRGNNNGATTTNFITTTSASSGYTGASGAFNAGAATFIGALNTASSTYFEFTITPPTGKTITLTDIQFGARSTGTGPVSYSLRSSADGYATDITTGAITNNSTWSLKTNTGLSASGSAGAAVTFRIYGYNGTGTAGTNTVNWRIDDLSLTGTVN